MTIGEALKAAMAEGWRGIIRKDRPGGDPKERVLLGFNGIWADRGNPECLEPWQPTVADLTSEHWEPSDSV